MGTKKLQIRVFTAAAPSFELQNLPNLPPTRKSQEVVNAPVFLIASKSHFPGMQKTSSNISYLSNLDQEFEHLLPIFLKNGHIIYNNAV